MDDDSTVTVEALARLIRQLGGEEELAAALEQTELPVDDPDFQRGAREGMAVGVLVGSAIRVLSQEPSPIVRAAADAFGRAWLWAGMKMTQMAIQLQQEADARTTDLAQIQTILDRALCVEGTLPTPAGGGSEKARDERAEDLEIERGPDE